MIIKNENYKTHLAQREKIFSRQELHNVHKGFTKKKLYCTCVEQCSTPIVRAVHCCLVISTRRASTPREDVSTPTKLHISISKKTVNGMVQVV